MNDGNVERAQGTRGFTVSAFPIEKWAEWELDCKSNFGNIYWIKIWQDHLTSKQFATIDSLFDKIAELEAKVIKLDSKLNSFNNIESEDKPKNSLKGLTFGG